MSRSISYYVITYLLYLINICQYAFVCNNVRSWHKELINLTLGKAASSPVKHHAPWNFIKDLGDKAGLGSSIKYNHCWECLLFTLNFNSKTGSGETGLPRRLNKFRCSDQDAVFLQQYRNSRRSRVSFGSH